MAWYWIYLLIGVVIGFVPAFKALFGGPFGIMMTSKRESFACFIAYCIFILTWPYFACSWAFQGFVILTVLGRKKK
jgi:hypothetical protein